MATTEEPVTIRPLRAGEEEAVCRLAREAFDATVAKDLSGEGIEEFHRYAASAALGRRLEQDHLVLVADSRGSLLGVLELRSRRHVSMLFVLSSARGSGLGRRLLERGLSLCREASNPPEQITVKSALGAVGFYERAGFRATGSAEEVNGIAFVPMTLLLSEEGR